MTKDNLLDGKLQAKQDVVASDIGGEWALLDLKTSMYYTLNETGAKVWSAMQSPVSLDEICHVVSDAFNVSQDDCRGDVTALVSDLMNEGLVNLVDANSGK